MVLYIYTSIDKPKYHIIIVYDLFNTMYIYIRSLFFYHFFLVMLIGVDGVHIPIYLFGTKDNLDEKAHRPCIIVVYGGFGVPLIPSFSPMLLLFAKYFNGIVCVANVRGDDILIYIIIIWLVGWYYDYYFLCYIHSYTQLCIIIVQKVLRTYVTFITIICDYILY